VWDRGNPFVNCASVLVISCSIPLQSLLIIKSSISDKIREDMCGFEEITREPDPIEVRPYGPTYVNLTMPPPPEDKTAEKQLIAGGKHSIEALIKHSNSHVRR